MPATDTDFDREFAELVAQLRDAPTAAPDSLRARVRALGEPEAPPTVRDRLALVPWRRTVLLAAPVCLAALLSVAVVRGVVSSGGGNRAATPVFGAARTTPEHMPPFPGVGVQQQDTAKTPQEGALSSGAGKGRPVHVDASMRIRVADLDALTDRTREAMQIVRSLGGYVASVQQRTSAGKPGEADLVLKVPVGHVDTALMRLSSLGTVLDQSLSSVDLQQTLDQQRRRIHNLELQIARIEQTLRDPSLTADVRLRLQFQLQAARQSLARLNGTNRTTLREAALSDVSLALTTQRAAGAATKDHQGRAGRAVHEAASFLAAAGAVALFVLIAVSPLLLIGAAWLFGSRAYRRREEQRLLAATPE
jgi:uncharacterized protein DUF4349